MMKRGASTVECIDIPDVEVRTRRSRRTKRAVKPWTAPIVVPKVKISLAEQKAACKILLDWKPPGRVALDAPFDPLEPTFSEVPLDLPRPDCVAGAAAPTAPDFSTKFGVRHTIPYPFTHKWTTSPEAVRTIWDFNTVNSDTVKQISFSPDQTQELLLTESDTIGALAQYGSIDVTVHSVSACGMKSPSVKMIICDTDVAVSPALKDDSTPLGLAGENLEFHWKKTSEDMKGHLFKLTWYTKHTKEFSFVGNVKQ